MKKLTKKDYIDASKNTGIMILIFAFCTALCYLLDYFNVNDLNFLIIYILGVLLISVFTKGFVYSSVLSVISVFGYNFFFTVPRYSLMFNDNGYLVTFVLMLAVGLGISIVTYQLKNRMQQIALLNIEKIRLKNEAEKEQVKATLLRSISHDLRTPLTTMKNGAELIENCPDLTENERNEILGDIVTKAEWTIRLIENLLSLTRIDSEKLTVKKQPEVLEEIIPQAVRTIRGILDERKINYEMPDEMLLVSMDATLIIQVIANILNNAVKHTENDGNIWIKVWNTGKNAVFRISNDGARIKEADLPHIFDMYYTSGDVNKEGGVGLGLAICKLIVTAHGGEITARQTSERVIFEFNLPMGV